MADLKRLEQVEQALHAQMAQRGALQQQLGEVESALRELAPGKEAYRILGTLMVKTDAATLKAELEERKATLQTRIGAIERQEQKLREELQQLQSQVLRTE